MEENISKEDVENNATTTSTGNAHGYRIHIFIIRTGSMQHKSPSFGRFTWGRKYKFNYVPT